MPSEPIPKFDGEASTFATFIMEFVGCAILQIDGVKYLHALEQNHEPNSWYTMKTHVGTGTNYHYEETDEFSTTYEEQEAIQSITSGQLFQTMNTMKS